MGFSRLIFAILLIVSLSTLGCRHFMYGDYSDSSVTGTNTVSGTVTLGSAGSIRGQMISGNAIPGARVWVEGRSDLFAVTGPNGEYIIDNVPAGKIKIFTRFRQGDEWYFDFDETEIAQDDFVRQNVDLSALKGKNIVTGILRDEDGNPLRNVSLSLWGDDWGDDFKTDENGRFTSPALPSEWDFEDLTQDITINRGQANEFRFPATFVSETSPLDIEIVVTDDPARSAVYPRVSAYAYDPDNIERKELIDEVEPEQQIRIRAQVFPANASNIQWTASHGLLSNETVIDFADERFSVIEQTWTSPTQLGVATITIEATNDEKTARARLPILVDGQAPVTTSIFESAEAADGSDGTANTTELTLTFSTDPTTLTADNITVTGATKGALSGTGTTRTLAISDITVANGETVSVEIANPSGYDISGSPQTAVVYKEIVYNLRDTGPAGGLVFYDKGHYSDGWRYLEAAPQSTEWTNKQWGKYGTDVAGTEAEIGTGKANTDFIVAVLDADPAESDRAAQLADALSHNGFNDWFLPSEDELNKMYVNLHEEGDGDFTGTWYWSSTQSGINGARHQFFGSGLQTVALKDFESNRVRAIRAF